MSYRIFVGEKIAGPFSAAEIQSMLRGGVITPDTQLCPEGSSDWYRVGDVSFESSETIESPQNKETSGCAWIAAVILIPLLGLFIYTLIAPGFSSSSSSPRGVVQSAFDGSVPSVKYWLQANAKDPDSIQYIEWSPVVRNADGTSAVRVKFRSKNSFGGYMIENLAFGMDANGEVVGARPYKGE